jgi:hypothetical protein
MRTPFYYLRALNMADVFRAFLQFLPKNSDVHRPWYEVYGSGDPNQAGRKALN